MVAHWSLMRRTFSRLVGGAFALLLVLQTSPARAQTDWRDKLTVVERLMGELIPGEKLPDLKTRWAVIEANAKHLREASSGPLSDDVNARLAAIQAAEDENRRAASST